MGKYSGVNAQAMIDAANNGLNEFSSDPFNALKSTLSSSNNLKSGANEPIKQAFELLNNSAKTGSIAKLKENLSKLKAVGEKIKKYNEIDKEIEILETKRYKIVREVDEETGEISGHKEIDHEVVAEIERKKKMLENLDTSIRMISQGEF